MIEGPNRVQNAYVTSMAVSEFKSKIVSACKGALFPVSEVGPVDVKSRLPLFEIRWQWITVQEILSNGDLKDIIIVVRMYHSEPSEAPNHFVGHHVHEKDFVDPDPKIVRALQDSEILVAKKYYLHGLSTRWGI
jgi:hypothetical protein